MKLAMMFPGQGSQSVGMLASLAAAEPAVGETFAEASAVLGYDLWALCQHGPEERLTETEPLRLLQHCRAQGDIR